MSDDALPPRTLGVYARLVPCETNEGHNHAEVLIEKADDVTWDEVQEAVDQIAASMPAMVRAKKARQN